MPFPSFNDLSAFTASMQAELQQFVSYLLGWLQTQHKDDGSHGAITADSVTSAGAISGSTGTFTGDVIADSTTTPITLGASLGTLVGTPGELGPGIDINGGAKYGRWTFVLENSGTEHSLFVLDRMAGLTGAPYAPLRLKYQPASNLYDLSPDPTTGAVKFVQLGDPAPGAGAGRWWQLYLGDRIFEMGRSTGLGFWQTVPYAAGNFTADVGAWTVIAGNQITYTFTLMGKTMTLAWQIVNATTTSTPNMLQLAIPGGVLPNQEFRTPCVIQLAAGKTIGFARVLSGDAHLYIFRDAAGSAFPAETNTVTTFGQIAFEVQ